MYFIDIGYGYCDHLTQ